MRRLALSVCVALLLACTAGLASAQDRWSEPAPGVRLLRRQTAAPLRIRALVVDLCEPAVSLRATRANERGRTVDAWARDVGAAAAVNGDFFSYGSYRPSGLAAGSGRRWTDSADDSWEAVFAYGPGRDGATVRIGGHVLDDLEPWMYEVVSGAPNVLVGGEPQRTQASHYDERHPRTGLGVSRDGRTLYLVTIDGRSTSSRGTTTLELGRALRGLGAHRAINLDGGGSTTMWVRGSGVVNRPSDGSPRAVANHLGVMVDEVDPGEPSWCCDPTPASRPGVFSDVEAGSALDRAAAALDGLGPGVSCADGAACVSCRATRGFAAAMLVRAAGLSPSPTSPPTYDDVPGDHPFHGEVERAREAGISNACGGGRMCVERPIRRGRLAIFAARALGVPLDVAPAEPSFEDVPVEHRAAAAVAALVDRCLMDGCAPGRFCPRRTATRAEVMELAARVGGIVPSLCEEPDPVEPPAATDASAPSAAADAGAPAAPPRAQDAAAPEPGAVGDPPVADGAGRLTSGCAVSRCPPDGGPGSGRGAAAALGVALIAGWRRRRRAPRR